MYHEEKNLISTDASLNVLTGISDTDEFHLQDPKYNHSTQNKSKCIKCASTPVKRMLKREVFMLFRKLK